ncbi:MAG: hypothetical protein ACHQUC_01870 [Chlamydiales bacterium]
MSQLRIINNESEIKLPQEWHQSATKEKIISGRRYQVIKMERDYSPVALFFRQALGYFLATITFTAAYRFSKTIRNFIDKKTEAVRFAVLFKSDQPAPSSSSASSSTSSPSSFSLIIQSLAQDRGEQFIREVVENLDRVSRKCKYDRLLGTYSEDIKKRFQKDALGDADSSAVRNEIFVRFAILRGANKDQYAECLRRGAQQFSDQEHAMSLGAAVDHVVRIVRTELAKMTTNY